MPRPWLHSGEINAFSWLQKVNPYLTLAPGQTVLTINGVRNEPESCTAKCSTRRPELRMLEKVKELRAEFSRVETPAIRRHGSRSKVELQPELDQAWKIDGARNAPES